jgi:hypothetical protein
VQDSPGCGKSETAGHGAAKHTGGHCVPLMRVNDAALRPPLKEKMFVGDQGCEACSNVPWAPSCMHTSKEELCMQISQRQFERSSLTRRERERERERARARARSSYEPSEKLSLRAPLAQPVPVSYSTAAR